MTTNSNVVNLTNPGQHCRQGDILLRKRSDLADLSTMKKVAPINDQVIVAYGEATGHTHAFPAQHAALYQGAIGTILVLAKMCEFHHQTHGDIKVPSGEYDVVYQRQYIMGQTRRVVD